MQLTVPMEQGQTRQVTVCYVTRGLAVQRDQHQHPDHPYGGEDVTWGVVHVPSGRLVTPLEFRTRAAARTCQQALLALDIDWQQPYSAFQTRAMRPTIRAAGIMIREHLSHQNEEA
jgi:hypothetical protein